MTEKLASSPPDVMPAPDGMHHQPAEAGETHAVESQQTTNARVASATGVLALGNIASRVLGLGREFVLSNLFGAGQAVDAYRAATNVLTAFYDLLIGGHVNGAIIPVLSEVAARQGKAALWRLVSVLMSLVTVVLALLVLLIELFAPQVVRLSGGGFDPNTLALATHLLRLSAPALLFLSLFAVFSGTLYALRAFSLPAFAGAVFNGTIVVVTALFTPPLTLQMHLDGHLQSWTMMRPPDAITITAIGWVTGALVQLALQWVGLRGAQLRFTFNWRHPAIAQIARLYAPVIFSLVLDTLVIRQFSYNLASGTGVGSISYMGWATTLIQFPQGLVATAISIAILPTLARQAALVNSGHLENETSFKDTLGLGLRLAIALIIPATVGLFVLATPIVGLLFEHGAFTAHDTTMVSLALRLYLVGLPFAAVDLLLVYAFYARQDTLTPALVGLLSLAVYMVTAVVLLPQYGLFSLMIADSFKHAVHALVSAYLLSRRLNGLSSQRLMGTVLRTGAAALALAVVSTTLLSIQRDTLGTRGFTLELLALLVSGGAGSVVYLLAALLLRIEEVRWLGTLVRDRLRLR